MKRLTAPLATIAYLLSSKLAFAQSTGSSNTITIQRPDVGYATISDFLNAGLRLIFIIALLGVLLMLVWGAMQWIFSGGEKEAVEEARNRILHALIGLAVLAVAFALVVMAGSFVGINLLGTLTIPSPRLPTPPLPQAP